MNTPLSEPTLPAACLKLAQKDADLAYIFETCGCPPLWAREPGFVTLVQIILEQQVSLASARAAYDKLRMRIGEPAPGSFLILSDAELKKIGFSRQKTGYVRGLAGAILSREIDLPALTELPDTEVKNELIKIKGIGIWTADIYLLMALLRPDVMPKGDLALHIAWQKLKKLEKKPTAVEFIEMAEKWSPYRSVAARLLWHFYLSG